MYIYCTNYHVTVLGRIFIVTIRLGGASVSDTRPSAQGELGQNSTTGAPSGARGRRDAEQKEPIGRAAAATPSPRGSHAKGQPTK